MTHSATARRRGWTWRMGPPREMRPGGLDLSEVPAEDLKAAEWRVLGLVKELQLLIDRFLRRDPEDLSLMEQIVATLIQYGLESGAGTLLFEPGSSEMSVRLCMDAPPKGQVRFPQSLHGALFQLLKEAAGLDPWETSRPQQGLLIARLGDRRLELPLVCLPGVGGEIANLHFPGTPTRETPPSFSQLGLFPDHLKAVLEALSRDGGLFLVAGSAGVERSRALHALLRQREPQGGQALCIEDPVHFLVPGTTQLRVKPADGHSYPELLRTCLREEPDRLLLGDLPDPETAQLALSAGRAGRTVLAGFPSAQAASVPADLRTMGVPTYLIASGLSGVLVQRRARRLCEECKKPDPNAGFHRDRLSSLYGIWDHFPQEESAPAAPGCKACNWQGFSGHVLLYECLPITAAIRSAISQSIAPDELQALAVREGMVTLAADGYRRVKMGETSLEELLRVLRS